MISQSLIKWYDLNKKNMPWRKNKDPYRIWISEVMLQQTQVSIVIPYYNKWIKKFPTIYDVAKASDQDLFKHWEGLGYYNRANNFRQACISIIKF